MKKFLLLFCLGFGGLLPTSFAADIVPPVKVVRYASILIQRYDENGDGILQREEWENMPGAPQAIDLDGDGQITKDELVWFLTHYGKSRTIHRTIVVDLSEPYKFDPNKLQFLKPAMPRATAPPTLVPDVAEGEDNGVEALMQANEQPIDEDAYLKLLEERQVPSARPYSVLPERLRGVPAWFILLDKNGDGQISLAEFAPTLSYRMVTLFNRLDKNSNGYIEPDEVPTQQTPEVRTQQPPEVPTQEVPEEQTQEDTEEE